MTQNCQEKDKKKKEKDSSDKLTIEDFKVFAKVLSKRYILAPIIMMILFLMDHPNQQLSRAVHEFLKEIIIP